MTELYHDEKLRILPKQEETARFIAAGYLIDDKGRPLHPLLSELDSSIPEGKGGLWHFGPNQTADPIVITCEDRPRVLLVTRKDGSLAFPGGFVDEGEADPIVAAYRELAEETGLGLDTEGQPVYQGIVNDPRTSANAWIETSAYLFEVPEAVPVRVIDENETNGVDWYYIDNLKAEQLYGSHADLLQKALEICNNSQRTIEEILNIPIEEREVELINAGHMAYDHFFTRHQNDHLFVKMHDSSRFTDTVREAHSRAYLQKEYSLFNHLKENDFSFIPNRVALIEDSVLAMDALHANEGWVWRAPNDTELYGRYVQDTIQALNELQDVTPPSSPAYHEAIKDTYSTLWEEGWDAIDDKKVQKIIEKIRQFSTQWTPEQYDASEGLIHSLPIMRQKALAIDRGKPLFMAHNDVRQSNIAWHPSHGTRLVDWSWGDLAPKNADSTMFLIDLQKSGNDVGNYLESFNDNHAHTLIGFWLAHSLWETRDGSQTVREHQIASAVAAYKLLNIS